MTETTDTEVMGTTIEFRNSDGEFVRSVSCGTPYSSEMTVSRTDARGSMGVAGHPGITYYLMYRGECCFRWQTYNDDEGLTVGAVPWTPAGVPSEGE